MIKRIFSILGLLTCTALANAVGDSVSGMVGSYAYVDLGLKSGTKWATCNIGAAKASDYGFYFAWGETSPKEIYTWATYKYEGNQYRTTNAGDGSWRGCVKYAIKDEQYNPATPDVFVAWYDVKGLFIGDNIKSLEAADDAATANWGSAWRMPTLAEQQELLDGCNWEWTTNYQGSGVAGQIGTSKSNGNIIFLPASGVRHDTDLNQAGEHGSYWASSLSLSATHKGCYLYFFSDIIFLTGDYDRSYGRSVRAVVK